MLVLKRLADAAADGDPCSPSIRGSAVNQDGRSSGATVPNGAAQEPSSAPRSTTPASTPATSATSRPTAPAPRSATRSRCDALGRGARRGPSTVARSCRLGQDEHRPPRGGRRHRRTDQGGAGPPARRGPAAPAPRAAEPACRLGRARPLRGANGADALRARTPSPASARSASAGRTPTSCSRAAGGPPPPRTADEEGPVIVELAARGEQALAASATRHAMRSPHIRTSASPPCPRAAAAGARICPPRGDRRRRPFRARDGLAAAASAATGGLGVAARRPAGRIRHPRVRAAVRRSPVSSLHRGEPMCAARRSTSWPRCSARSTARPSRPCSSPATTPSPPWRGRRSHSPRCTRRLRSPRFGGTLGVVRAMPVGHSVGAYAAAARPGVFRRRTARLSWSSGAGQWRTSPGRRDGCRDGRAGRRSTKRRPATRTWSFACIKRPGGDRRGRDGGASGRTVRRADRSWRQGAAAGGVARVPLAFGRACAADPRAHAGGPFTAPACDDAGLRHDRRGRRRRGGRPGRPAAARPRAGRLCRVAGHARRPRPPAAHRARTVDHAARACLPPPGDQRGDATRLARRPRIARARLGGRDARRLAPRHAAGCGAAAAADVPVPAHAPLAARRHPPGASGKSDRAAWSTGAPHAARR